jgi:putative ATPase
MGDLFGDAAAERAARSGPLAHRVRPRTLDELVGQTAVIGPATALGRAIEKGRSPETTPTETPGVAQPTTPPSVAKSASATFE